MSKEFINPKPFLGWSVVIKNIYDDTELDKFIKENYGQGCLIDKKVPAKQNGVYEIEIKGEDWDKGADLGTTTCPINSVVRVLYSPPKNKLMSVNLGQECTFGTDYNSDFYKCYDEEMINSFEFY